MAAHSFGPSTRETELHSETLSKQQRGTSEAKKPDGATARQREAEAQIYERVAKVFLPGTVLSSAHEGSAE